jgi:hypothetical protein
MTGFAANEQIGEMKGKTKESEGTLKSSMGKGNSVKNNWILSSFLLLSGNADADYHEQ